MSKRSNGEGSVRYDKERSRWEARLTVGFVDGRQLRKKFTGPTRRVVTAKLKAAVDATEQGLALPDNRTSIESFAAWWLAEVLPSEQLAPRSEQFHHYNVKRYVVPHVGQRALTGPKALTPADVEALMGTLAMNGLGQRTQAAARVTLSKMLAAAQSRGLVARNVARLAKPPRDGGRQRAIKALSVEEAHKLLKQLEGNEPWHTVAVLGLATGLRPQELLGLAWRDIDLDSRVVSVRRAISHATGVPTLKAPKRQRSYRRVPMPVSTAAALRRHRDQERLPAILYDEQFADLVFLHNGVPLRVDGLTHALADALPGASGHRLRHTFATHLLEGGTPIHHVAELLGDSVSTVEAHYSHVMRTKTEVAILIEGLVGQEDGDTTELLCARPDCK